MTAAAGITAVLLLWAATVAMIDWRQRRVPNGLLLLLLAPALLMLTWRGIGLLEQGWLPSLSGFAAGLLLTLPGYAFSKLGAGDVKLAASLGLVLGWPQIGYSLLVAALLLAFMTVAALLVLGSARIRELRIPAAVALTGGFAAVLLMQAFGVRGA